MAAPAPGTSRTPSPTARMRPTEECLTKQEGCPICHCEPRNEAWQSPPADLYALGSSRTRNVEDAVAYGKGATYGCGSLDAPTKM